jgi:microcystin-dependent protein
LSNEYYDHGAHPATGALSSSSAMRDELDSIELGFDKLPRLKDAGGFPVFVKLDESGLETRPLYSYDGEPVELLYRQYLAADELDARTVYFIPDWMDSAQAIVFNNVVYHVLAIDESKENLISMTEEGRILLDRNNVRLVSPLLEDTPTAPTQATTDNSTKVATTAFVKANVSGLAPLASPAFSGTPTAPTQATTDNSTKVATTAFVGNYVANIAEDISGVLTGGILWFPFASPPTGWLECNGALISRSTYSKLWAAAQASGNLLSSDSGWNTETKGKFSPGNGSSTFRLPDLRGEFVRGWDHGSGIDSGRGIGSWQEATGISAYAHSDAEAIGATAAITIYAKNNDSEGIFEWPHTNKEYYIRAASAEYGGYKYRLGFTVKTRNVALLPCIKY